MTRKEQIDHISKLLNELSLADLTSIEFDEMFPKQSINELKDEMWRIYRFVSDVCDIINMGDRVEQEPKTGHWIDLNELEEGISRGCEFAGTQEVVHDTFLECINELSGVGDWDEMTTIDLNDKEIVLQDLMERFYDKIARNIYNYATTCCREG